MLPTIVLFLALILSILLSFAILDDIMKAIEEYERTKILSSFLGQRKFSFEFIKSLIIGILCSGL